MRFIYFFPACSPLQTRLNTAEHHQSPHVCPQALVLSWDPSLTNRGEPVGEQMNKLIPAAGGKSLSQGNKTVCHMRRRAAQCVRRVLSRQRPMDRPLLPLSQLPQPCNLWLQRRSLFFSPSPSLARDHTHTHTHMQEHTFLVADTPSPKGPMLCQIHTANVF